MRLLIATILISIISAMVSPNQSKNSNGWATFSPKMGDFSIQLPGVPEETQDHFVLSSTKVDMYGFTFRKDGVGFFILRIGDIPAALIEKGYLDSLFENAYKILLEYKTKDGQTHILETSQKKIQLGNYLGYEYNSGCGPYKKDIEPCKTILRVYKVERRIYLVGLSGPDTKLPKADIDKFFSSFSVVKQ
jgi:hypothetical protein